MLVVHRLAFDAIDSQEEINRHDPPPAVVFRLKYVSDRNIIQHFRQIAHQLPDGACCGWIRMRRTPRRRPVCGMGLG
jgi:hypothetical protein